MSKSTKIVIKTKVKPALLAQIDGLAQAQNQSISQLMLAALNQYLDLAENRPTATDSLQIIQAELKLLQAKINKIDQFKQEVDSLSFRLNNLEQLLSPLQSQQSLTLAAANFSAAVDFIGELDEDDIDDEPDEILTDFVP
ncbi:hypothetical protein MTo_03614 [Microcystis aeruginosa NIES-1211]|jgi:hypothetical protein|uniref:Ribbon-helix-helix protein CopG domain-containing protein n=1 Tax=Microcystis aeruginosa NIES-2519 TaxID=2303981 RepID=A0A5A5R2P9_MICAE|nr:MULTISPECIES: ribbon-helix-helix protein, CopG family [Microcystis]AVQ70908.1 hypothetical protein B5D77_05820 [Microcystis sp. MC19]CCI33756.1 conserved hypothetical protein [Microcystis sp. T1-4]GBL16292.1 hypothetical protein MTo_03614 [Microcystis aeruginosa NIES-1211]GCA68759.1 hypothetical protein MiYa_00275 [Microcystis aeruginosa NIES-2519]GCA85449.1 hypothetical protein MiHa_03432 [Microcystis aeruginosa NIES-2522]